MVDRAEKRYGKKETEAKAEGESKKAEPAKKESADMAGSRTPTPAAPASENQGAAPSEVNTLFAKHAKERQQTNDRHERERTQMHGRHAKDHKDLSTRHAEEVAQALSAGGGPQAGPGQAGGTPGVGSPLGAPSPAA